MIPIPAHPRAAARLALALVLLGGGLAGCQNAKVAEVTGKVSYKNQALGSGVVTFVGADGTGTGEIRADGTYTVPRAPVGPCKVTVQTFAPAGGGKGKGPGEQSSFAVDGKPPAEAGPYVAIPAKYADVNQSGLSFDVKPGRNSYPITLE